MDDEKPVSVVLVEDNEADVYIITDILKSCGFPFELKVLHSGESALERFRSVVEQDRPSLLLLDLNIPRFSGLEVLETLRKGTPFREIPVVVVTSSDSPEDVAAAEALGIKGYFRKPTSLSAYMELGDVICRALQRSRPAGG